MSKKPDYSYQSGALQKIIEKRSSGGRVCACAPTGAGKTRIITELFSKELSNGGRPIVYTHRRVLREQLSSTLARHGISHGIRASGVNASLGEDAQVSSVHTEAARAVSGGKWPLHAATLAIYDECHAVKGKTAQAIMEFHSKAGAYQVGFSATPVGLKGYYMEIVHLVSSSELRAKGVIVPCEVFAPSEIDMSGVSESGDDYVQEAMRERFNTVKNSVIGDIHKHYLRLNPLRAPTVLFAPGVPESRWITEYMNHAGVSCVHLEAKTKDAVRNKAFSDLTDGSINMISSFGIINVGWDCPRVSHAIFCRPTKSVAVYLQSVGRILRASPGKDHATLQDHTGSWYELGSPNEDRHWEIGDTARKIRSKRRKKYESALEKESEPVRCPSCSRLWRRFPTKCLCGHKFGKSQRRIIQVDGRLVKKTGAVTKKRKLKRDSQFIRSGIWAASKCNMTVGQAFGIAVKAKREYYGKPLDLSINIRRDDVDIYIPLKDDPDWHKKAAEVYPWTKKRAS
jgi:superfamily II DNA or RNA helicase